ncbi:MAG TPA: CHAT domain-containing protein [Vicinamibacteria bacterium]|nr:CHAT domain-containing protein [Vicinamibacteria bacterium]
MALLVAITFGVVSWATASGQAEDVRSLFEASAMGADRILAEQELSSEEGEALRRAITDYGAVSRDIVPVLVDVVRDRIDAGKLGGPTLTLALSALHLAESVYGPDDPHLAEPLLIQVGYLLHVDSKWRAAKEAFEWALRLLEKSKGPESPEVADVMSRLAGVLFDLDQTQDAVSMAQRALRIRETNFGESDPRLVQEIYRLGNLLFMQGRYRESAARYQRAIDILERASELDEMALARGLNNLGETYRRLGRLDASETILRRALRIRLRTDHPEESPWPESASTYTSLGELLQDKGEFSQARRYFEAALEIMPDWFGKDAHRYAETLSMLAVLLEETGNWEKALELQSQSLGIRLSKLASDRDPRIARTRFRLGSLFIQEGNLTRAGKELELAQSIQEEKLPLDHTDLAETLVTKAEWHEIRNELRSAEAELERAISIYERLSPDHAALIEPLEQLARVRRKLDDVNGAESAVARGVRIAESFYGPESPNLARLLHERSLLLSRHGYTEDALRTVLKAESIARGHVWATVHALPEQQALNFIDSQRGNLDLALSLLEDAGEPLEPLVRSTWDALIRSRALVLESLVARARVVRAQTDPALRQWARALSEARSRLAGLLVRSPGDVPHGTRAAIIHETRLEIEQSERKLSEASEAFLRSRSEDEIGLPEVTRALPSDAALVAFVRYRHMSWTATLSEDRYAAFVLPGRGKRVTFVPLGSADAIDTTVREWRELIPAGLDGLQASETALRSIGARLHGKAWQPLTAALGEDELLFLVPDGSLNLVNFGALPSEGNRYLIESGPLLHVLGTERDVVTLQDVGPKAHGLLAFGGADFDAVTPGRSTRDTATPEIYTVSATRALKECALETRRFSPLPGTMQEVSDIVEIWRGLGNGRGSRGEAVSFTGIDASEANWKRHASSFRILHLATHGFFQGADCVDPRRGARGIGGASAALIPSYHQYALSGLALAGANRTGPLGPNQEDGFLTALEAASEDLSHVEWAVLSACDTGVAEVRAGEGTFGLRRAFAIAGVRTLIMSLWTVQDVDTPEWMRELYHARLRDSLGTAQAARRAGLNLLASRREKGLSTHPVFWGGFIASGDWK